MKKMFFVIFLALFSHASPVFADRLPSYYPDEGFARTGRVNAVYPKENRVIIDDIPYQMSQVAVVHSLSAKRDLLSRIRPGAHVAFRMGSSRVILEFWILPSNYKPTGRK